jgi:hypothetical protein
MLPAELIGPSQTVLDALNGEFVLSSALRYPALDVDFIRQVCFEHPRLFDDMLPGFDVNRHGASRVRRTAGWIYDSVRFADDSDPDHWAWQLDDYRRRGDRTYFLINSMLDSKTWPFPPVIISGEFALAIGNGEVQGFPFSLIEGHHRLGHMRRMVQSGLMERDWPLEVIELVRLQEY